jgi:hypothetical protein
MLWGVTGCRPTRWAGRWMLARRIRDCNDTSDNDDVGKKVNDLLAEAMVGLPA